VQIGIVGFEVVLVAPALYWVLEHIEVIPLLVRVFVLMLAGVAGIALGSGILIGALGSMAQPGLAQSLRKGGRNGTSGPDQLAP
jgi:hypothetical protein